MAKRGECLQLIRQHELLPLNGREVYRAEGRLTLADGTRAGAHLALGRAVRTLIHAVGEPLETALARAISGPTLESWKRWLAE